MSEFRAGLRVRGLNVYGVGLRSCVPLTTDQAICIRVWDWSETSQTVSLFTREHGVLRCVAKGAKRDNGQFSGGLEVMTRGEAVVSIKSGGQMSLLTAWDLQEMFLAPKRSLSAFYQGLAMMDLLHHGVHEHDPHARLFDCALTSMRELDAQDETSRRGALLGLLWAVLDETGHRPEVQVHASSGVALPAQSSYVFAARLGGLVADGAAVDGPAWRVRSETVALLRALAQAADDGHPSEAGVGTEGSCKQGAAVSREANGETIDRATRLLALYFREVFAVEPSALKPWLTTKG